MHTLMNRFEHRRRERGATVLEISIAMLLLTAVLLPMAVILSRTSRAYATLAKRTSTTARASVIMDRLVAELTNARFVSLTPPIPDASTWVRFEKIIGFDGDIPLYSDPVQIDLVPRELRPEDGIDDDGDGLIDEGAIRVWVDHPPYSMSPGAEDEETVVAKEIAKAGLSFTRRGAFLEISSRFEEVLDEGEAPVSYTVKSGVLLRRDD